MPASKKNPTDTTPATVPERNDSIKNVQPTERDPKEGRSSHDAKSH